tara:strand:+ start:27688 stop:28041 length:354 start_codon:yes stop_codon:yes gene_type:complete
MLNIFKIKGDSMMPTITSGSFVFTYYLNNYDIGDLIVLRINEHTHIIKRITAKNDGKYQIVGDNKNTSSSFCDYTYSSETIIGRVIFIFNPVSKFSKFVKFIKSLLKYEKNYGSRNN